MKCPTCGTKTETKIVDTRKTKTGTKRLRQCPKCEYRFTTYEVMANSGDMAGQIVEWLKRYT